MTMARWFWDALDRRNDVEVYSVGPFFDDYIPWNGGMHLPKKYVKVPTVPLPANTAQLRMPYEAVAGQMPEDLDLFLQIDAGWHFVTRPHAKVVAHIQTDPHVLKGLYTLPKSYSDFNFCMQTPYLAEGEQYLPYAYDPTVHYSEEEEKIYDVCLIGLHYNSRSAVMDLLKRKRYKVKYEIGPIFDEYRQAYNQSKVAFSWSSMLDMPARVWEAFALGVPLVTNRIPDLATYFVEGEHYLGFDTISSTNGAIEMIEFLLNNPEHAQIMANAAHRKVKPHTWDNRINQILITCKLR
jgi:glycosyltransferase involved in cell wall biosynthesis